MMPPWLRHGCFDVTHHSKRFESLQHQREAQSSGIFHDVDDAIATGIIVLPRGADIHSRNRESTHLMSKDSRGVWHTPHHSDENGLSLVPGSLNRIEFERGPRVLLEVQLNSSTDRGSDPSLNRRRTIIFVSKCS